MYKSLNINTGTEMKKLEILKNVPHYLKTKKISNHTVKKLPCLFRYSSWSI